MSRFSLSSIFRAVPGPLLAAVFSFRTSYTDPSETRITREEVARHRTKDTGIWVTHGNKVLDITEFVDSHPGGKANIMQAAGGSVDDFWDYWAYHHVSGKVTAEVARLQIGTLTDDEASSTTATDGVASYYSEEPARSDELQTTLVQRPYCSETKPARLHTASNSLTPNNAYFVRNHAPVPASEGSKHVVEVCLSGDASSAEPVTLTVADLRSRFPQHTIVTTMQCSGNRASEMVAQTGPTAFSGTPFENIGVGMVGTAAWTGPRLLDVLSALHSDFTKLTPSEVDSWHVVFEGGDLYSSSTPLSIILESHQDTILALDMNGEPLPPDHGAPVRVLMPGITGARNVKWLSKLTLSTQECDACWNARYYKHQGSSIQRVPMQSLITSHETGETINPSQLTDGLKLAGVAWSGGTGNEITRVDVSLDDGVSWCAATLCEYDDVIKTSSNMKHWAWKRWHANLPADNVLRAVTNTNNSGRQIMVCVRATDNTGRQQPSANHTAGGYLYNGWHRVTLTVTEK